MLIAEPKYTSQEKYRHAKIIHKASQGISKPYQVTHKKELSWVEQLQLHLWCRAHGLGDTAGPLHLEGGWAEPSCSFKKKKKELYPG